VMAVCGLPWLADFKKVVKDRDELREHFEQTFQDKETLKTEMIKAEKFAVLRAQVNSDELRAVIDQVVTPDDYVVSVGTNGVVYSAAFVKFVAGRAVVVGWTR